MTTKISLAVFSALLSAHLFAQDVIRGEDHFEFHYHATIPTLATTVRIWLPLAGSGPFQDVAVEKISAPVPWQKIQDRNYGNNILLMELGPNESGKSIVIDYQVTRREKSAYPLSANAARFLKPERLVPITDRFKALAEEATRGKIGDLARGRALYDHVLARVKYDKTGTGWGRGDAAHACNARTGATAPISIPISSRSRVPSTSRLVLPSGSPSRRTKIPVLSAGIIAGRNLPPMENGFRSISAKRGKRPLWLIIISGTSRQTASSLAAAAIWKLRHCPRPVRLTFSFILISKRTDQTLRS